MKLSYQDKTIENWFLVSWTLSNKCNYRCSYCPPTLHNGSTGQPELEHVESFIKNFDAGDKQVCYRISGGEPTYYKHFKKMAKMVNRKGHQFTFLTNGSQKPGYFEDITQYTDGMMISYHPEQADPRHIVNVCNVSSCPIVIQLMMVPDDFDNMVKLAEYFHNNTNDKVTIHPKVILDKTSGDFISNKVVNYSDAQKDIIKNWPYFKPVNFDHLHRGEMLLDDTPISANDLIVGGKNNFEGWKCWAGIDGININMWGDIYRADCMFGGKIGSIKDYSYTPVTEPIVCGKNTCACLSDIYLRKESF